jgi:hypothetical protein
LILAYYKESEVRGVKGVRMKTHAGAGLAAELAESYKL